jgi:hypothetical protein
MVLRWWELLGTPQLSTLVQAMDDILVRSMKRAKERHLMHKKHAFFFLDVD